MTHATLTRFLAVSAMALLGPTAVQAASAKNSPSTEASSSERSSQARCPDTIAPTRTSSAPVRLIESGSRHNGPQAVAPAGGEAAY